MMKKIKRVTDKSGASLLDFMGNFLNLIERKDLVTIFLWCPECDEELSYFYRNEEDEFLWSCFVCRERFWVSEETVKKLLKLDRVECYMWCKDIEDKEEAARELFMGDL